MAKAEKCFVIMPFSETTHGDSVRTSKCQWDHIYEHWIKRAVHRFKKPRLTCRRSPVVPGNFVRGIVADLSDAYLVIADITGNKANVFYELGIRHALKTGTILITQDIRSVPSDLKSYYTFEYQYSDKAHEYEGAYAQFEKELHEKMEAFGTGESLSDSPVSDYLGLRAELMQRSLEQTKAEIRRMLKDCGKAFEENYNVCEFLYEAVKHEKEIPLNSFPVIDTFVIDTLYSRIVSSSWSHFSEELNTSLRVLVSSHRNSLLMVKQVWNRFFMISPSPEEARLLMTMLEHIVNDQKPIFEKSWPDLMESFEKIGLVFAIKDGRKKKQIPIPPRQES